MDHRTQARIGILCVQASCSEKQPSNTTGTKWQTNFCQLCPVICNVELVPGEKKREEGKGGSAER